MLRQCDATPSAPTSTSRLGSSGPSRAPVPARGKRSKSGCLTCRLRKKRCDEAQPACVTCERLGLECLGYQARRPEWMRKRQADLAGKVKHDIATKRSACRNRHWADRAQRAPHPAERDRDGSDESDSASTLQLPDRALEGSLLNHISDVVTYPLAEMVDGSDAGDDVHCRTRSDSPQDVGMVVTRPPTAFGPLPPNVFIDPDLLNLLGFASPQRCPLLLQPTRVIDTQFSHLPDSQKYFDHYLTVIMPYQWIFERKALSDVVAPLAFANPVVFEALTAMAALHMGRRRTNGRITNGDNPDLEFAEKSLARNVQKLKQVPLSDFGTLDMIVATMSASSFHLFDGGNRKGWSEAVDLCRRCLSAAQRECGSLDALMKKLGHLLSPLIWTDIMTSVTEGVTSEFLPLYRTLLLDVQGQDESTLLRETVMGCDSTTRLAIAETIALSEWKERALSMGQLSIKDLVERAASIERLLGERRWREKHLVDDAQRKAVSDVFFHGARVLLATTLNGPFPGVAEVATTVRDTANAFHALDQVGLQGADRALVFPAVIAGCHAESNLQSFFKERFDRLEDAAFGNTRNARRLMEQVWVRRATTREVHWRKVMFELDKEGLLLI